MTDPFDALRAPAAAVPPDPTFAADLRRRLQDTVLGRGGTVTTLTPYLAVRDARGAIEFYVAAFGARRRGEPVVMDDGVIGHAEVEVGDSVLMLAEEFPSIGHVAPRGGGASVTLHLAVDDVDATVDRAVDLGATLDRAAADNPYGRNAALVDPFGHRWLVATADTAPAPEPAPAHGDLAYLTHRVPDADRARAFYGAVLGWRFSPGRTPGGWQVEGTTPHAGIWGGGDAGIDPVYQVDDVEAAVQRVRTAGGRAGEPQQQPYGRLVDCTDDQGIRFQLLGS